MADIQTETIVLCDFDGTITRNDVTDEILNHLGDPNWQKIGERYIQGKISHAEMNTMFAEQIHGNPEEVISVVNNNIYIREGFDAFVDFIKKSNMKLLVVSSGWDFYIQEKLKFYNPVFLNNIADITAVSKEDLPVISNKIVYHSDEKHWKLNLLWNHISCGYSSPCKAEIVRQIERLGFTNTVAIGNSESDICMAEVAKGVFSTGTLTTLCLTKNILSTQFNDFSTIINKLKTSKYKTPFR